MAMPCACGGMTSEPCVEFQAPVWKTWPHGCPVVWRLQVRLGLATPYVLRAVSRDLLNGNCGRAIVPQRRWARVDTRFVRRIQRTVVAAIVVALMLGSVGLCEAAMAVMMCRRAPTACPLHAPPVDPGQRAHVSPSAVSCCVVASNAPVPGLAAPGGTTATRAPQASMPRVALAVVPSLTITTVARSSPVRQATVPQHLLFSVFLL